MTDKEKLIALLQEANAETEAKIEKGEIEDAKIGWEFLADHLLANGVVVREKGEWKYYRKQGIAVCTSCSFERKVDDNFGRAVACPNCGADMRGAGSE